MGLPFEFWVQTVVKKKRQTVAASGFSCWFRELPAPANRRQVAIIRKVARHSSLIHGANGGGTQ